MVIQYVTSSNLPSSAELKAKTSIVKSILRYAKNLELDNNILYRKRSQKMVSLSRLSFLVGVVKRSFVDYMMIWVILVGTGH